MKINGVIHKQGNPYQPRISTQNEFTQNFITESPFEKLYANCVQGSIKKASTKCL